MRLSKIIVVLLVVIAALGTASAGAEGSAGQWLTVSELKLTQSAFSAQFFSESFGVTTGHAGEVYTTSDGGESWSSTLLSLCCYGLYVVDEQTIWTVGNNGAVNVSTDGGATWNAVQALPDNDHIATLVSFVDDTTGWVSNSMDVWSTADGGETWQDVNLPEDYVWGTPVAAISLLDGEHAYLTDGVNLYSTADGGVNWVAQPITLSENRGLSVMVAPVIRFVDENNGVIVFRIKKAGFAVLRTRDGGVTWTEEALPFEGGNGVLMVSPDMAYVTYLEGAKLTIAHYEN